MDVATDLALSPALIASAAAGDRVAFGRIVAQHHDDLVRIAYLVSGDADLARSSRACSSSGSAAPEDLHEARLVLTLGGPRATLSAGRTSGATNWCAAWS